MRFDWAGIVSSLNYKDHEFFGEWFDRHNPLNNESVTGPVEGFAPIAYDAAKAGETFLMIGVGMVKKANDKVYSFARNYDIVNGGEWKVNRKKDRIEFTQQLKDESGYSYTYKKTVRLIKGKPVLLLEHSLNNTGLNSLETTVFNHNFLMIDKQATGPDFTVTLPFKMIPEKTLKESLTLKDNQLIYNRVLKKGESGSASVTGFSTDPEDYDIRVDNTKTGSGVRITSDRPLNSLTIWAINNILCPEPYIKISAPPGQEFKWTTSYEFKVK